MPPSDRYILEAATSATLSDEDRWNLSESIRQGKIYAFVEIPKTLLDKPDFEPTADPSANAANSSDLPSSIVLTRS